MPFSMWNEGYRWGDFPSFIRRRLIRVHPLFLIACVLAIILNLISLKILGNAGTLPEPYLPYALESLAVDGTYLSGFLNRPTILVVAWTLAIEIQFHLLAGALVHFMKPDRERLLFGGLIALSCTAFVLTDTHWIFPYLPYFALGWAGAWLYRSGFRQFLPKLAFALMIAFLLGRALPPAAAALGAILFIMFGEMVDRRPLEAVEAPLMRLIRRTKKPANSYSVLTEA